MVEFNGISYSHTLPTYCAYPRSAKLRDKGKRTERGRSSISRASTSTTMVNNCNAVRAKLCLRQRPRTANEQADARVRSRYRIFVRGTSEHERACRIHGFHADEAEFCGGFNHVTQPLNPPHYFSNPLPHLGCCAA